MVVPTVAKASRWTGADAVLQEHQAAVANMGKQLMRAFVIFNGVVRSGAIVWHGTAQRGPWCWLLCRPMIATWPYFSPGSSSPPMTPQVISKYRSSTEQSVPVCCPHPRGGRKEGRVWGEVGTIVLLLHILPYNAHRQTHAYNNANVRAVAHPHSTLIMIHTKPHKHLPTSAQEPQPNTNTEPKHIVESLSFSLWPVFFLCG